MYFSLWIKSSWRWAPVTSLALPTAHHPLQQPRVKGQFQLISFICLDSYLSSAASCFWWFLLSWKTWRYIKRALKSHGKDYLFLYLFLFVCLFIVRARYCFLAKTCRSVKLACKPNIICLFIILFSLCQWIWFCGEGCGGHLSLCELHSYPHQRQSL